MAARTLGDMVAAVARTAPGVPLGEIAQALFNYNLDISAKYPWPWLVTDSLITMRAPYTTGTVTVTSGSTTVTGTGTSWDTTWRYKTLRVSNVDYPIASFASTTSLTLSQAPILDATLTDTSYTIIQDIYALPSDYLQNSDISFQNQSLYYEVKKIPLQTLMQQSVYLRLMTSAYVCNYADYGWDDTNSAWRIKVNPPPASTAAFKFVYRRIPPDLAQITSVSLLPMAFVEMLEKFAEAEVKRVHKIPGWREAEAAGNQKLYQMKRALDTQNIVNRPEDHGLNQYDVSYRDGIFSAVRGTS